MHNHHVRSLPMALDAGVNVVMGTDAGGRLHGDDMSELKLIVKAWMTLKEAIVARVRTAAECIALECDQGMLEPGKRTDLLVGDGDPLGGTRVLRRKPWDASSKGAGGCW